MNSEIKKYLDLCWEQYGEDEMYAKIVCDFMSYVVAGEEPEEAYRFSMEENELIDLEA